jgi:hypothetical protein
MTLLSRRKRRGEVFFKTGLVSLCEVRVKQAYGRTIKLAAWGVTVSLRQGEYFHIYRRLSLHALVQPTAPYPIRAV